MDPSRAQLARRPQLPHHRVLRPHASQLLTQITGKNIYTKILTLSESRPPADPFKLPAYLRAIVESDIAGLESEDSDAHGAEGDRIEASGTARSAFDKLEAVLHIAYNGISAIPGTDLLPTGITEAERLGVFTTYGWEKAQIGRFPDHRLLVLAELALQGDTTIANPAWRYAASLISIIQTQLDIIEEEESIATTGHRQVSVASRAEKRDLVEIHLSRVRYHYCSASDDLDMTKELAKIAFQPRRPKGTISYTPAVAPVPATN